MPTNPSNLANTLWLQLIRTVQRVSRAGGEKLRERGLSAAQFELLAQVYTKSGQVQQDLAEELGVTKGNISQLISKLEAEGLLERTAQGAAFTLSLTRTGQKLMQEMLPDYTSFVKAQFASLSTVELEQLHTLLTKLEQR
jgi:DNA-binding MarR family transcriptional regulator